MKEGTLVWFELYRNDWHPGVVVDYRPQTTGGSWSQSYSCGGRRVNEFMSKPVGGECLVQLLDGEGIGWVDEQSLRSPEEHEMASAQGAS